MFPSIKFETPELVEYLPSLKLGEYLLKHQRIDGSYGNLEETYWAVTALAHLHMLDAIDNDSLLKYILDCKRVNGFAASPQDSESDLHSFFYAIKILALINHQHIISVEEYESMCKNLFNFQRKDGGFAHCNLDFCPICRARSSLKSTYFAIAVLKQLYDINSREEKRILVYLSKSSSRNAQQVFRCLSLLLLNHIEEIDDVSLNYLVNLQQDSGGVGVSPETTTLEYSFWVLYCLDKLKRLRNINKGKLFEYIRNHQKDDKSFLDGKTVERTDQYNILDTAWASISLTILWNELTEYIEQKILAQLYSNDRVPVQELAEECFVQNDFIIYITKRLMNYDWFSVEIQDSLEIFKKYVQKFDAVTKRIAVGIVKGIVNQSSVNLSDLAKNFSANDYPKALERVVKVANTLLRDKFINGEIKWNKRFFRVTGFLEGVLAGNVLVRLNQIPYHEVLVEKGQIPIEQRRIQETIDRINPLTERIQSEIENLLDLNEVGLAKEQLRKNITNAMEILNNSNQNIELSLSKFQYLDGRYTQYLLKDWVALYQQTKDSLLEVEREFLEKIQKKERNLKILNDLSAFQNYVQEQLNKINEALDETLKLFQQSSEEHTLELNKDEINQKLDEISLSIERITPELRKTAGELSKVSTELRLSQETPQLEEALQPLEKWLESMWMKKRKNTITTIKDIKGHLNQRQELQDSINHHRDIFNKKKQELSIMIKKTIDSNQFSTANTTLNQKTEEILQYLSESNQYILNYIQDTASYLEGFQSTVDDVYQDWTKNILEEMRNELFNIKNDLEQQILSKKELDKIAELNTLIDKNIFELKKKFEETEKLLLEFMKTQKLSETIGEMKRRFANVEDVIKFANQQIQSFIKKTMQEFRTFPETSQVTLHKWTLFKESSKRTFSLISDRITNELILKMLITVAPIFRGGRVKLDYLSSKLNLKKDEIEDRIVSLLSMGKFEGQFDKENNEIIPLTNELKALLKFEQSMKDEMESLKVEYDRTKKLFETSCKKKQLDDHVITEILERTRGVLSKKYETEVKIERQIKQLPAHIDLNLFLEKWYKQKSDVEETLASIKAKITNRKEIKDKITQFIQKFKAEISEVANPIEMKIDFGEFLEANRLLSKNFALLEQELRKFDEKVKIMVNKLSNELQRFDLVVADISIQWNNDKTKLLTDLSDLRSRLKEKINEGLLKDYKQELEELYHHSNLIITNFLNNFEKGVDFTIQKGEIDESRASINTFHAKFTKTIKGCEIQIIRYISLKSLKLKNFKDAIQTLTARWEASKQEHQKAFQDTYLQLENQLIIKYLQIQQSVFITTALSIAAISKKLRIKKSELRQRFISLIAAEKLSGRLDPTTDQYIFPSTRIEEARLERPPPSNITNQTESPLPFLNFLGEKFSEILRKWYPVIGTIGTVASISYLVYSLSGNLLPAILIPSIIFPLLLIYVYIHYWRKRK